MMIQPPQVYHMTCSKCGCEMKISADYADQISDDGYFEMRCDDNCGRMYVVSVALEAIVTIMATMEKRQ